jgi:chromosome condensin MukBEF ATPase and DNA-binding subunit MukB
MRVIKKENINDKTIFRKLKKVGLLEHYNRVISMSDTMINRLVTHNEILINSLNELESHLNDCFANNKINFSEYITALNIIKKNENILLGE